MRNLQPIPSRRVMRAAAVLLSAIGLALLAPCVMSIYAAGVVSNCGNDTDLSNKLAGGGVVSFNCGPHATIVFASTKTIAQDTTIDGAGAITLSGGSSLRLFNVSPGVRLTLNDITIAHGYTTADGGAINSLGTLVISNTQFLDNHVGTSVTVASGGAIYSGGPLTITNSVFDGNSASTYGGGIAIFALATLTNVTATHNMAFNGGAIYNKFYLTNLNNSTLVSNTAGASGGAIYNFSFLTLNNTAVISNVAGQSGGGIVTWSLLTLNSSTLARNTAFTGGAIDNESGGNDTGAYVIVNNSRLHDNSATSDGGAIFNADYGHVTLANSVLNANIAGARGGGIDNQAGRLAISASWLYSNSAASGAAIFNFGVINRPATLTLTASTLSGNAASAGGGALYNSGFFGYTATATMISSTLSGNSGGSVGGGIANSSGGILNVSDSTLSGNKAALGGGIYLNAGSAALINATLSGNSANTSGGGLMLDTSGAAALLNVTLSNNSAITGGGLTISGSVQAVLTNTIVAYSGGGNCKGTVTLSRYSLSSDGTCTLVGMGNQNSVDPKLSVLGNFTGPTLVHMLKSGSPAINSGTATGAPGTDQRGYTRPQSGGFDMGAVERRPGDSDFPLIPRLYLPLLLR